MRYDWTADQLSDLLLQKYFPERRNAETAIIKDFLKAHGAEYDGFDFSVRVGQGITPDPSHLPGVQANAVFSSKKKIDVLLWRGVQPTIAEVKQRLGPGTLGQLQTYRHLWMEEHPAELEPRLIAIARTSDDDTNRVLAANGVTIYLYDPPAGDAGAAGGGVSPSDAAPA